MCYAMHIQCQERLFILKNMKLPQDLAVYILESIGLRLWGFKPNMMRYFVLEYGSVKSVWWFVKNMPRYERILKSWGPIRTHLISTALSTLRGCSYCTYGHAYALQLQYFKQTDQLFPLGEDAIINLHGLPEEDVLSRLAQALRDANLQNEIQSLNRLASLRKMSQAERANAARNQRDDSHLIHLMGMFAVLNSCGIKHQVMHDEAHDPINQDERLRFHYAARRAS